MNAANDVNLGGAGEGFGIIELGGHGYGSNSLGVWMSGNIRIGLSDTINEDFNGIGIVDARLSPDDLKQATEIHAQLCKSAETGPAHEVRVVEPSPAYYVDCVRDGKDVTLSGKMHDLPESLFYRLHRFKSSVKRYLPDGRTVLKLNARVTSVKQEKNTFLVSVQFSNIGAFPISFRRPDTLAASQGDRLNVQGSSKDGKVFWETDLAGMSLLNESEIKGSPVTTPNGEHVIYVTVEPYSSVTFKFRASPDIKVPHGAYSFNLVAALDASAPDVAPSLGFVDFHSDYKNPYRVTFDRDYPSTPEDWKDFEARKAKQVSALLPGATVAESGYYRMVAVSGPRSRFLTKLEAGKPAPKLDINHWDRWEWEADLARTTVCYPGDVCPREGRWVVRSMVWSPKADDQTHANYERRFRVGDTLPTFDVSSAAASKLYWEWMKA